MTDAEKDELLRALVAAVPAAQEAVDAFDEAAAELLGLNRTDLRCLGALYQDGPMSAGELALRAGLSRPAMTTAIDRLERAGYVRRVDDRVDRRRVLIEITPRAQRASDQIWSPPASEGLEIARRYSVAQLRTILDYVTADRKLHHRHVQRLRAGSATSRSPQHARAAAGRG